MCKLLCNIPLVPQVQASPNYPFKSVPLYFLGILIPAIQNAIKSKLLSSFCYEHDGRFRHEGKWKDYIPDQKGISKLGDFPLSLKANGPIVCFV